MKPRSGNSNATYKDGRIVWSNKPRSGNSWINGKDRDKEISNKPRSGNKTGIVFYTKNYKEWLYKTHRNDYRYFGNFFSIVGISLGVRTAELMVIDDPNVDVSSYVVENVIEEAMISLTVK